MLDFKDKMHQIRFPLGLHPRPRWGSLQRSPRPLAVFKGHTSKGREEEGGGEGKGEGKGGEKKGGEGWPPIGESESASILRLASSPGIRTNG